MTPSKGCREISLRTQLPEVVLQKTFAEELLGKLARGVDETSVKPNWQSPLLGKS